MLDGSEAVTLRKLVKTLWAKGIAVVRVERLPKPKFRAMCCKVEGRPVILLAHGRDDQPSFLWDLAHETGHIACGHVDENTIAVDDGEAAQGDDEKDANKYARALLMGAKAPGATNLGKLPTLATQVALSARSLGKTHHIDPGLLVHFWAQSTPGAYGICAEALQLLRKVQAKALLEEQAASFIDEEAASETDSNMLRCLHTQAAP